MIYNNLIVETKNAVLSVALNRPAIKNAFNDELILELIDVFSNAANDTTIRAAVITGEGDAFCAGGDINWMKKSAAYTPEKNKQDAGELARMLTLVNTAPFPVITGVHGPCFGGGLGLVAASDHVIAASDALFSFSEVRLGLIPAVISPFVIEKIGLSQARSLFLTADRFPAARAFGIGLVHQVVENQEKMKEALKKAVSNILTLSPNAVKTGKKFLREIGPLSFENKLDVAAGTLAELRASKEGQEGLTAFLEKRKPNWIAS